MLEARLAGTLIAYGAPANRAAVVVPRGMLLRESTLTVTIRAGTPLRSRAQSIRHRHRSHRRRLRPKEKDGRRNRYRIQDHLPLRVKIGREPTIGEVLGVLVDRSATQIAQLSGQDGDSRIRTPSDPRGR